MLLRLNNGPRTFDFRPGKQGWGHAMHSSTFSVAKPRLVKRGWFRKPLVIERISVMVHCQGPRLGDFVIYLTQSERIRTCVIVDIIPCGDPRDMYTLILEEAEQS
ncbi:hypothetical protein D869_gp247 [Caulobacter phage CcrRogue]|uniref:Uncharacterized protein n=1 Tax=Caulobacter phage CcrRogue TaxID=2927986 RepID=K4K362_9CAUD|nr:hypothetical protein D869_gp247 [Caulobacter phage CcrRogue]AFU86667.1 hypothetical protein CcrRogue_gp185 [Caulobacter phage CcrRogue]